MRQKIVAGNWKMNLNYAQAMTLSDAIADGLQENGTCEVVLAAPSLYLHDVLRRVGHRDRISISAQNCAEHASGAYTGEVSAMMLASIGIEFVIIGHSERRQFYGDNDAVIANKVRQALQHGITPIFCCGEALSDREAGRENEVVDRQLQQGLFHLSQHELADCVIAYEPVWAIGTGKTATAAQAQSMHQKIRSLLDAKFSGLGARVPILYGGSVTATNAGDIFTGPDVDGALVGGASLKAADFLSIISACNR